MAHPVIDVNPTKLKELTEIAEAKVDKKCRIFNSAIEASPLRVSRTLDRPKHPSGYGFPFTYGSVGNIIQRPLIDVKNVDLGMAWGTMQISLYNPRHCRIMEGDFFRVGLQNAQTVCKLYWEDLVECRYHEKRDKRIKYLKAVQEARGMLPIFDVPQLAIHGDSP